MKKSKKEKTNNIVNTVANIDGAKIINTKGKKERKRNSANRILQGEVKRTDILTHFDEANKKKTV